MAGIQRKPRAVKTAVRGVVNVDAPAPHRQMFHTSNGGVDFARLVEQLVPSLMIGVLVVYANFKVMQTQVEDLRKELDRAAQSDVARQQQIQAQSEKLAGITAQITAFLGQQVTINTSMDARLTYIERLRLESGLGRTK